MVVRRQQYVHVSMTCNAKRNFIKKVNPVTCDAGRAVASAAAAREEHLSTFSCKFKDSARVFSLAFCIVVQPKLGLIVREWFNNLRCLRLFCKALLARAVVPPPCYVVF